MSWPGPCAYVKESIIHSSRILQPHNASSVATVANLLSLICEDKRFGLLRDQMMQLFLQRLPRGLGPNGLMSTVLLQMRKYLSQVLDLISRAMD
jgi:hypothetical protein